MTIKCDAQFMKYQELYGTGFLYRILQGKFQVEEVTLYSNIANPEIYGKTGFIRKDKRIYLSRDPGVFYNGMVWLEKRDDTVARDLLIRNENEEIAKLEDLIKKRKAKISALMEELK